jgi:hypothetical protein
MALLRLAKASKPRKKKPAVVQRIFESRRMNQHPTIALEGFIGTAEIFERYRGREESLRVGRLRRQLRIQESQRLARTSASQVREG